MPKPTFLDSVKKTKPRDIIKIPNTIASFVNGIKEVFKFSMNIAKNNI